MEKEDWVQKKDSYQRRLHLRGCLWSRDRCLVSSLGPRTVNLPFPPSLRDVFFLSKLVWNSIQMQIWRGLLSWTSAFPTRLIKQVWNGQMIRVSTVTTMCVQVGSGIRYKDGQRKGKAASQLSPLSPPPPNYFLFWLVGFQTTSKGWLGYKSKTQEDVTTLWVRHWWCHTSMTGSGGFTPGTPVSTHKKRFDTKREQKKKRISLYF